MTVDDFVYTLKPLTKCGYCHECSSRLVLARFSDREPDEQHGEEYCPVCDVFPDYASHTGRGGSCPDYRMQTLLTRLRLIASPDVVQMLREARSKA